MDELKEIKKLFKLMVQENLYELNIEEANFKVTIKRKVNSPLPSPHENPNVGCQLESNRKQDTTPNSPQATVQLDYIKITSPINGVFYRTPSPGANPFVEIGSIVNKGDTVCIVEAMKLMNEIQSDVNCKIVKIMVENATNVVANQVLFLAEPVEPINI